jgi:hypothetical protein
MIYSCFVVPIDHQVPEKRLFQSKGDVTGKVDFAQARHPYFSNIAAYQEFQEQSPRSLLAASKDG